MKGLLQRIWQRFRQTAGLQRDWYLLLCGALIGLVVGAAALAFIHPLHILAEMAEDLGTASSARNLLLIIFVPVAGALLTGLVLHFIRIPLPDTGVSGVIYAIHREQSRLPWRLAVRKWLASTFTIGFGGSAGPEGPIVAIGSVIGSGLGRLFRVSPQETVTLLGCGAAAGIASVFNAPIAGIFFVLEVLLRDFSLRTFSPIVIASVVASTWTLTMQGGNNPLFGLDPNFYASGELFTIDDIPSFVLLAIACGLAATLVVRLLFLSQSLFEKTGAPIIVRPAIGAVLLGLLGAGYVLLVSSEDVVPPFFGSGYPVVETLLDKSWYLARGSAHLPEGPLALMLLWLVLLKTLATCLTLGSGGSGGLFAPALVLGAALGGFFGVVLNQMQLFPAANPAHYALVGMAAMLAATSHAPLTAILLVYELTREPRIVLPIMLAAIVSTIVARLTLRDSVYTWPLSLMGLHLGRRSDQTILRQLRVRDVPLDEAVLVEPGESARRLLVLLEQHSATDFVVVDQQRAYLGMITAGDLRSAMLYHEVAALLQVGELQRSNLPTVTLDESLDMVLDKFSRHDVQSLPVLNPDVSAANVLGLISRERLMRRYQSELQST